MPRFAANLTMMFNEWEFLDRFDAAAESGFDAVEFLFPYDHAPEAIAERLTRNRLTPALFNLPPGDWQAGERGLAALPARREDARAALARAIPYIEATGIRRVHLMSGIAPSDNPANLAAYIDTVKETAERLAAIGVTLVLEPINPRDMPGYFLSNVDRAATLIAELALPNLRLQFDIYHCQIIHGDVTMRLRKMMPLTGHVQIASVPSRNEPDREELNYGFLYETLDALGYAGFVGCEYRPRGKTRDGLGWFAPFARHPA
jgi:2-dehydrotetronate isomerase